MFSSAIRSLITDATTFYVFVAIAGAALLWIANLRPRLALYSIFALVPTQFLFIPVGDFYISPADVLVIAAGAGLVVRALARTGPARAALRQHLYAIVMVAGYLLGFLVLTYFSRTLVRVAMAIVPSILACELLRTRQHLARAATALVAAGVVDAAYGAFYYASGAWLHPTRFSGMSGVNFSAMVIITAAAIGLAKVGRATRPAALLGPTALLGFGAATLSRMGLLAFAVAWLAVLSKVVTRRNKLVPLGAALLLVSVALASPQVRDRMLTLNPRELQQDNVWRSSTEVRTIILQTVVEGFRQSPLAGVGYFRFQRYSMTNPEIAQSTMGPGYATHNTYLEVLVEGGLLAFIPFLLHLLQYARGARLAWRAIARDRDVVIASALVGLPIVAVSAALANLLVHYSFWAVCGLGLACLNVLRAEAVHAEVKCAESSALSNSRSGNAAG